MLSECIQNIQYMNITRIPCEHIQDIFSRLLLQDTFIPVLFIIKITFSRVQETSQDFQKPVTSEDFIHNLILQRILQIPLNSEQSDKDRNAKQKDKGRNFFDTCCPKALQLQGQMCIYDILNVPVGWCCWLAGLGWVFPAPGRVDGTVGLSCCWWWLLPAGDAPGAGADPTLSRGAVLGTSNHGNAAPGCCSHVLWAFFFYYYYFFKRKNILKVTISVTFPRLSSCCWWCS